MGSMDTFEQQLTRVATQVAGPERPVDAMAVVRSAKAAPTGHRSTIRRRPGADRRARHERGLSVFSATKLVAAAAIIALFGGFLLAGFIDAPEEVAPPAATTEEPSEGVSFDPETMKMSRASGEYWNYQTLDGDATIHSDLRSHTHNVLYTHRLSLDDPRLSGKLTGYMNYDQFRLVAAGGSDRLLTGAMRIDNDEGSWIGQMSGFSDDVWRWTAWLEGDGAYEGMGAVIHFEQPVSANEQNPTTINALVFPGDMPPFPAIPEPAE